MRAVLLLIPILTSACGLGRTDVLGSQKDAGLRAPKTPRDAGPRIVDAGFRDAGPPDSGYDQRLGEVLSCDLDYDEAFRAAARFVSCTDIGLTMVTVIDGWEGFLLGSPLSFAAQLSNIPVGCGIWQCAAQSPNCSSFIDCVVPPGGPGMNCRQGSEQCAGNVVEVCEGDFFIPHIDCGRLGATCQQGFCVIDGCRIDAMSCNAAGNLTACNGALELNCEAWRPGSACGPFYVGGEVPVEWCAPNGEGRAGAYNTPVECDGRTVSFESLSGRSHTFDCLANGYRGCDERGCL